MRLEFPDEILRTETSVQAMAKYPVVRSLFPFMLELFAHL